MRMIVSTGDVSRPGASSAPPEVSPLRSPASGDLHALATANASKLPEPPLAVVVLNRMGFGPRPGDIAAFDALGPSDDARLAAYVEQQLYPENVNDSHLEPLFTAAGFRTLNKTRQQLWTDHAKTRDNQPWAERIRPFDEVYRATFLRAIHSKRQLNEVLADFWHNHFNVYGPDFWAGPFWVHYDRDVIRANIFGNFRKMLEDVATSFPMLLYLDNFQNRVAGPNENYARELFELHGLGAENYLGVRRQDEVDFDNDRRPVGYVDDDVYESTRAFTGWSVDFNTGEFLYVAADHDRFQKYVLGRFMRSDQAAMKDGRDVLDLVAAHPGTARHVARKLCRRLITDNPPQRLVDEVAAVFTAKKDAPDQLRHVYRAILLSPEFRTGWGQKVKRPFEYVVGCMRAIEYQMPFSFSDDPTNDFLWRLWNTGQPLFHWQTPDGYPDVREKWAGSNAIVGCWRIVTAFAVHHWWWDRKYKYFHPFAVMPATTKSPEAIVDFWITRLLGRATTTAARDELIAFMARGRDPKMALPNWDEEQNSERVHGLITLILQLPENHLR